MSLRRKAIMTYREIECSKQERYNFLSLLIVLRDIDIAILERALIRPAIATPTVSISSRLRISQPSRSCPEL